MADKNELTEGNLRVLRMVFEHATNLDQLSVDFDAMAKKGGWANGPSARRRWQEVKTKLTSGVTAGDASTGGKISPSKRKAPSTPKSSNKKAKTSKHKDDDDDDELAKVVKEEADGDE